MTMANEAKRSRGFKRTRHVLDFLVTWPLRYVVVAALSLIAAAIVTTMVPHAAMPALSSSHAEFPPSYDITVLTQHVADAHLFGQAVPQAQSADSAPTLVITIEGLLYSDDPESALAILSVDDGSRSFKVGDTLPDGESLTAIGPAAILLTRGDTQRIIEISNQAGGLKDGISLASANGLVPRTPLFPGLVSSSGLKSVQPGMHAVSLLQNASPLEQLSNLRRQLIRH